MTDRFPFLDEVDARIYATYKDYMAAGKPLKHAADSLGLCWATFNNKTHVFRGLEAVHNGTFKFDALDSKVLDGVSLGLNNQDIGARVFTSGSWVKTRVMLLTAVLQAKNRVHLVRRAYEVGLLPLRKESVR